MSKKSTTTSTTTYETRLQEMSEQYINDTSPERLTAEEVRTIQKIFNRRNDGDLSVYAESLETLNEFRLSEFFKYLPYAMATIGQHIDDKNIKEFICEMSDVCDFLFYIAEVRDSYRAVAYFLREIDKASIAYAVADKH
jgi:hypothetical protein